MTIPVPRTSARRGKRRKVMHGCRLCAREWHAEWVARRDQLRTATRPRVLRLHCNGKWET